MRAFARLLLALTITSSFFTNSSAQTNSSDKQSLWRQYLQVPLSFELNQGQTGGDVRYLARGAGYALLVSADGPVLSLRTSTGTSQVSLQWIGVQHSTIAAEQPLQGKINYVRGNDPAKWIAGVPTFGRVRYRQIYPGIDAVLYGSQRQLEYDLVVCPGADLSEVRMRISGANKVRVAEGGDLVLKTNSGELWQKAPVAYQIVGGKRRLLAAKYVLRGNELSFEVPEYDPRRELVVDPTLVYQTYFGGTGGDVAHTIAVDGNGRAIITGRTTSGLPTKNAFQGNQPGDDAFVTKVWATGGGLIYSTYLGGNGYDEGISIAVDRYSNVYAGGITHSTNFPGASKGFQHTLAGASDGFVSKLDPNGKLLWSSYYGGMQSEWVSGLTVDSQQRVYITGFTNSPDLPIKNAAQVAFGGLSDAFVARFTATGAALSYSTYLGGSGGENAGGYSAGITVDGGFQAYVTGTTSEDSTFPTTAGAFRRTGGGVFVTKLSATGGGFSYSTLLGGGNGVGIAVDSSGRAYVTGYTNDVNFPVTPGAYQTQHAPQGSVYSEGDDVFVTRLNATGSALSYSTFVGGTADDLGRSIAVNSNNEAFVAGDVSDGTIATSGFPVKNGLKSDGVTFLFRLSNTGQALIYSTPLWGWTASAVRLGGDGSAYVTGGTVTNDLRTTPGAYDRTYNGGGDTWVAKISP